MKRLAMLMTAMCAAGALAMPTKNELKKAQPLVAELMAPAMADFKAAGTKDKAAAAVKVADTSVGFAEAAETEAAKFLLLKGAVNFYTRGEAYDKAADAVADLQAKVKDVPSEVIAEITGKATGKISEAKAPRLFALYRKAKLQLRAASEAKALALKLKKVKSDALQRRYAEALAGAGDWKAAYGEFAKLSDAKLVSVVDAESKGKAKNAESGEFWWAYQPDLDGMDEIFKSHAAMFYRKALAAGEIAGLKKNVVEQRIEPYGEASAVAVASAPASKSAPVAKIGKAWQEKGNTATLTLKNGVGIDFVKCPAGSFKMMIDFKSWKKIPVTITRPFWFSKTVLTKLQMVSLAGGSIDGISPQAIQSCSYEWYTAGDDAVLSALNKDFGSSLPKGYVFRPPTLAEYQYAYHADAKFEGEPYYSYPRSHWLLKSLKERDISWSELGETCNGWGIFDLYKSSFVLDKLVGTEGAVTLEQAKDLFLQESERLPDSTTDPFYWHENPSKWVTRINWRGSGVVLSSVDDTAFFHLVVGPDLVSEWKAKHAKK